MLDNSLLIQEKPQTDQSWEQVWTVGKAQERDGSEKTKTLSQQSVPDLVKQTQKQVWFDLIAAGTIYKKIH